MRIILLTARYYPHTGGLESVTQNLASEFNKAGNDVLVITNRYPKYILPEELIDGIQVRRFFFILPNLNYVKSHRFDLFFAGLFFTPITMLLLIKMIKSWKPDIINLHYLNEMAFFLLIIKFFLNIPTHISLHGGDVDGEPHQSKTKMWLFKAALKQANLVSACSRNLAEQASQIAPHLKKKIQVIHNGVNTDIFKTAQTHTHHKPYLFSVGQLVFHKGFHILIHAYNCLSFKGAEPDLIIGGEGPYRNNLETIIEVYGKKNSVHLVGKLTNKKLHL